MEQDKKMEGLKALQRGLMIVFEGLDKSGKSTQVGWLVKALVDSGLKAEAVRFPDRLTPVGILIDQFLNKKITMAPEAIHLLFSANRWEKRVEMEQKLAQQTHLVLDRYAYSGVAYTAAKGKYTQDFLKNPDRGLLRPDIVFYMDVDPTAAQQRGDYGEEVYEKLDFQQAVAKQFKLLKEDNWVLLDAAKSREEIHAAVLEEIRKYCEKKEKCEKELSGLWSDFEKK